MWFHTPSRTFLRFFLFSAFSDSSSNDAPFLQFLFRHGLPPPALFLSGPAFFPTRLKADTAIPPFLPKGPPAAAPSSLRGRVSSYELCPSSPFHAHHDGFLPLFFFFPFRPFRAWRRKSDTFFVPLPSFFRRQFHLVSLLLAFCPLSLRCGAAVFLAFSPSFAQPPLSAPPLPVYAARLARRRRCLSLPLSSVRGSPADLESPCGPVLRSCATTGNVCSPFRVFLSCSLTFFPWQLHNDYAMRAVIFPPYAVLLLSPDQGVPASPFLWRDYSLVRFPATWPGHSVQGINFFFGFPSGARVLLAQLLTKQVLGMAGPAVFSVDDPPRVKAVTRCLRRASHRRRESSLSFFSGRASFLVLSLLVPASFSLSAAVGFSRLNKLSSWPVFHVAPIS